MANSDLIEVVVECIGGFFECLIEMEGVVIRDFFFSVACFLAICGAVFALTLGGYHLYKYFAPKYAAVDREVFKESPSYNDGMVRDLENLMMEYQKADTQHKEALRATILHRFSVFPIEKMPAHIYSFYHSLKREEK